MVAIAEKGKTEAQEIQEIIARASKFFNDFEDISKRVDVFRNGLMALRADLVQGINAKEAMVRKQREAEINLAKTEQEANVRLSSVEQGHQALIERLSKQEVELGNKMADCQKRENAAAEARQKYELLVDAYEQKIAGLTKK